ncbi:RNA-binding protein [uncultured Lactobacillus sp.]|uniref:YlmH family RNA-binding protein n=1 Tax=uncultured Lactobacillus sp. TaxID=153152 RepID=UPI0026107489|nr:YlmH/Sll1252 family protein [uncultured Lactobacillus sp.]
MQKRQASSFYQHFDYEERPEVDYYTGLFNRFIYQQEPILTDFLNPRQIYILKEIVGSYAQIYQYGGYKDAEKQRALLCGWDYSYDLNDFKIQLLQIEYNKKWDRLNHSQILGVLANSGVELNSFGDIINDDQGNWQVFVKSDLADFFVDQIDRIGRSHVKLKKISSKNVLMMTDDSVQKSAITIALRLDAVVSSITNMSRSQAKEEIKNGNIKLNWHETQESNIIVNVYDILSIRHFGRIKIEKISHTSKGKYRLEFKVWQAKKR